MGRWPDTVPGPAGSGICPRAGHDQPSEIQPDDRMWQPGGATAAPTRLIVMDESRSLRMRLIRHAERVDLRCGRDLLGVGPRGGRAKLAHSVRHPERPAGLWPSRSSPPHWRSCSSAIAWLTRWPPVSRDRRASICTETAKNGGKDFSNGPHGGLAADRADAARARRRGPGDLTGRYRRRQRQLRDGCPYLGDLRRREAARAPPGRPRRQRRTSPGLGRRGRCLHVARLCRRGQALRVCPPCRPWPRGRPGPARRPDRHYGSCRYLDPAVRHFPENAASLALHRRAGFRIVGARDRPGRLRGRWRDVVLVERRSPIIT
jgi:hypothetical protein